MKKQIVILALSFILAANQAWATDYEWIPTDEGSEIVAAAVSCGGDDTSERESGMQSFSLALSETQQEEIDASIDAGNDVYVSVTVQERIDTLGEASGSYRGKLNVKVGDRVKIRQVFQTLNAQEMDRETVIEVPFSELTDLSQTITVSLDAMASASCPDVNPTSGDQASSTIKILSAKLYY